VGSVAWAGLWARAVDDCLPLLMGVILNTFFYYRKEIYEKENTFLIIRQSINYPH
jgi:hypothetical protein